MIPRFFNIPSDEEGVQLQEEQELNLHFTYL